MVKKVLQFIFGKKLLLAIPIIAGFLLYPFLAKAPEHISKPNPSVLGVETINPLGQPLEPKKIYPPKLARELSLNSVQAKSFLVYDVNSGEVLTERNSNTPLAIASVTKLMTGLVAYRSFPSFKNTIVVDSNDQFNVDPNLNLRVGDEIEISDIFYAMLVGSANDAALTLANHAESYTKQNFVDSMNDTAKQLEMNSTHFSNPLGFDSEANYSTAQDLKKLISAVQEYQAFNLVGRTQSYSFTSKSGHEYAVKATNKLIDNNKELYAIKTGYTNLAQGAMITQIREQNHPFVIIVLDSPSRENDTLFLKSEVLKNYVW